MNKILELVFVILASVLLSSSLTEGQIVREPRSPPQRYQTLPYYPPPKKHFPIYRARRSAESQQYKQEEIYNRKFQILSYYSNRTPSGRTFRARRSPQNIQGLPYYPNIQQPKYQNLPYYYPNENHSKTYLVRRSTESQNYEQYKPKNLEKSHQDSRPRPLTWPTITPHIYTSSAESR